MGVSTLVPSDDLRRRRRGGAEPGEDGGGVAAVVAPRLQVVGDARDLEAARLRVLDELEQLPWAELLVGRLVAEGEGHTPHHRPIARPVSRAWHLGDEGSSRLTRRSCIAASAAGYGQPPRRPRASVRTVRSGSSSPRVLRSPRSEPQPGERFDVLGLALLSPGLALMIYGLAESASSGGFGATEVWAPALIGAALVVGFVFHALRTPYALIDLRLFKNRTFSAASATLMLMIISVFGAMLLLPLYLQAVRGESAFDSGLLLAPQGIGAMIVMPIAGQLADRTGVGRIVVPGLLSCSPRPSA